MIEYDTKKNFFSLYSYIVCKLVGYSSKFHSPHNIILHINLFSRK